MRRFQLLKRLWTAYSSPIRKFDRLKRPADAYFRPAFLPSCLPAFLPSCLPAFLPSCLPAFLPSCLPAFLPSCLPAFLPSCLPAFLPSCLPAFLPSCLPAFLRSCRPAFLPSSVPVVLRRIPRLRSPLSPRRSRSRRRQPASPDAHSQQSTRVPAIVPVASGRPAITNFLSNHECHGRSIKRWMCGMPFRIGINRSASSSPVPCGLFSDQ